MHACTKCTIVHTYIHTYISTSHDRSHRPPPPPSPPIPTHPRRHRASRVRSATSHRSMVASVMDDERVIKSALTPEVRTALDDGEANVFFSLSSSSSRPRIRVVGDDARARILGRGAPRKSLRNSLAVTSSRRARGRARGRALGERDAMRTMIFTSTSRRARGGRRAIDDDGRRRRETTTDRAEGDARRPTIRSRTDGGRPPRGASLGWFGR